MGSKRAEKAKCTDAKRAYKRSAHEKRQAESKNHAEDNEIEAPLRRQMARSFETMMESNKISEKNGLMHQESRGKRQKTSELSVSSSHRNSKPVNVSSNSIAKERKGRRSKIAAADPIPDSGADAVAKVKGNIKANGRHSLGNLDTSSVPAALLSKTDSHENAMSYDDSSDEDTSSQNASSDEDSSDTSDSSDSDDSSDVGTSASDEESSDTDESDQDSSSSDTSSDSDSSSDDDKSSDSDNSSGESADSNKDSTSSDGTSSSDESSVSSDSSDEDSSSKKAKRSKDSSSSDDSSKSDDSSDDHNSPNETSEGGKESSSTDGSSDEVGSSNEKEGDGEGSSPDDEEEAEEYDDNELGGVVNDPLETPDPDAVQKSGVVFCSRIPPFMSISKIRSYFGRYGKVGKIYAEPESISSFKKRVKLGGNKKVKFVHGWIEFLDKKVAKLVAARLNGQPVGEKKRHNFWRDDLWNLKYLPRYKFRDVMEYLHRHKNERKEKLTYHLSQSRKENYNYLEQLEAEKRQKAAEAIRRKKGLDAYTHKLKLRPKEPKPKQNEDSEAKVPTSLLGAIVS
ncbi:pre-rRNA-processing ESF2 [Babesia ovata]|uniref:Pre-rRNA-processing ESF2 n=1 Tax=Babesia ovata TaxID=189622 RepID=A0A2H6KA12_9APIC|nr:pre-rRNA-processing ESF2 [Babesia ovata]GBE59789.1 pre-rRNA-processing ESF2 [Babesia ovata]